MKSSSASLHLPPRFFNDASGAGFSGRGVARRRLAVFCMTFLVVTAVGLGFDFSRPAQYRAEARLEIEPGGEVSAGQSGGPVQGASSTGAPQSAFVAELQRLTSRPLVEKARARLLATGMRLDGLQQASVDSLQAGLGVEPVPDSKVAQLWSVGGDAETTALLLNALIAEYRAELAASYDTASADTLARAREEVDHLQASAEAKRAEMEAFQLRYGIVSGERDDNAPLNHLRDSAKAMVDANTRLVAAEAKLNALKAGAASGQAVTRSRDNPTLAGIEQRLSMARENLRDMERNYTQDYLAIDPNAKALRARITELERQLGAERRSSGDTALAEAEGEVADARAAVQSLQRQASAERGSLQNFSLKLAQFKTLQQALTQLEGLHHAALERAVKLEASERARMPSVKLIEEAAIPHEVWRPRYLRDAGIVLGVALLVAVFAVWLLGFIFTRERPPAVVFAPSWPGAGLAAPVPLAQIAPDQPGRLLASAPLLPRELAPDELAALLDASTDAVRIAVLALLAGLSVEELLALRWQDLDLPHAVANIAGSSARTLALPQQLTGLLQAASARCDDATKPVVADATGGAMSAPALQTLILCAAHDAGLVDAAEVTPAAVRHSYLVFLLRQGVRMADLFARVGVLPADVVPAYTALAPTGRRLDAAAVQWTHPAVGNAVAPTDA